MPVRFDESLPKLVKVVAERLGEEVLMSGVVLRDAAGRLAFFASRNIDEASKAEVSEILRAELTGYARTDRVLADAEDLGVSNILSEPNLRVKVDAWEIRLIDRRLVGADWLRMPVPAAPPPPRFVFSSLKGGVGRSTALSVAAVDFAAHGRRVLAIDLDMEAPGLGAMLLDEGTTPEFGVIDALVEDGLSGLDDAFLADLVGPSALADRRGKIDVIPAFGRRSLRNPGEVLAKIARAYTEVLRPDGTMVTMLDRVGELVNRFSEPSRYDVILFDARAGLNESTAAAISGLGAEVFLFGLDEPQTFQGYAALLAHLARLIRPSDSLPEWTERFTVVQGKAPADAAARADFAERFRLLLHDTGFLAKAAVGDVGAMYSTSSFSDVPWDEEIHDEDVLRDVDSSFRETLSILHDNRFLAFDPFQHHDLMSEEVYKISYGSFLENIHAAFSDEGEACG